MPGFTGGCLCGAIRYEVSSDPVMVRNCHCDNCRKATGASFATNVFVKLDDLTITKGTPGAHQHSADSGNILTKQFCAACGSQLFNQNSARPGMTVVRVGSIDDARFLKPTANLYTASALPFTHIDTDLQNFEKMPD